MDVEFLYKCEIRQLQEFLEKHPDSVVAKERIEELNKRLEKLDKEKSDESCRS